MIKLSKLTFLFCCIFSSVSNAQMFTITPTYTTLVQSGLLAVTDACITFGVNNSNPSPIQIEEVAYIMPANSTQTWTLWYKTTPLNGNPGNITVANGWTVVTTQVATSTAAGITTVLTSVGFSIPASTTYRFALSKNDPNMDYGGAGCAPNSFTQNGVSLYVGDNPISDGWSGDVVIMSFNPRFFQGSVTFGDPLTPDNAGVDSILLPNVVECSGPYFVKARVKNFGSNQIDSVRVGWSVDGTPQPTVYVNTPLPVIGDFTIVDLGWANIPFPQSAEIKVWTSLPNGVVDTEFGNDTSTLIVTANTPGITLTAFNDTMYICDNEAIVLDAGFNANTDYTWSNGTQAQVNIIYSAGTYWVWAYNPLGCQAFDTFEVMHFPSVEAGPYVSMIDNGLGEFTFNISSLKNVTFYEWNFGDNSPLVQGSAPISHTYTQNGSYIVKATLANECDTIYRYGNVFASGLNLKSLNNDVDIKIIPNPAKESLVIQADNIQINGIALYNIIGQKVYLRENINSNKTQISVDMLSNGMYQLHILTNEGIIVRKIEVVK